MNTSVRVDRLEGRLMFAAGDRDLTFGSGDGEAAVEGAGQTADIAFAADGSVIVAGGTEVAPAGGGFDIRLVRYRPDGTLDPMFGAGGPDGDGVVTVDDVSAHSAVLALDPQGRIVVAVRGTYLVRFMADGTLDTTFGEGGKALAYFGHGSEPHALRFEPDGKIVVGVHVHAIVGPGWEATARFDADGSLDASYDFGGTSTAITLTPDDGGLARIAAYDFRVVDALSAGNKAARVQAPAISAATQPDGKIVALDTGLSDDGRTRLAVLRFNADGTVDPTFAHAVARELTSPNPIAVQPRTGRIVLSGGFHLSVLAVQAGPPLAEPRPVSVADTTPPTAAVEPVAAITAATTTGVDLVVRYTDDAGFRADSFDGGDLRVTAPDGSTSLARLVAVGAGTTDRSVTYSYTPPGGGFTSAMNGTFFVSLEPGQVLDVGRNPVAANSAARAFTVSIRGDAPNLTAGAVRAKLGRARTVISGGRPGGKFVVPVSNPGTRPVNAKIGLSVFASADETLDAGDREVASWQRRLVLRPQRTRRIAIRPVSFPADMPAGAYRLLARVDVADAVAENSEVDNVGPASPTTIRVAAASGARRGAGVRRDEILFEQTPILAE